MNCKVAYNLALVVLNDDNVNAKVLIGIAGLKYQKLKHLVYFYSFSAVLNFQLEIVVVICATQHSYSYSIRRWIARDA